MQSTPRIINDFVVRFANVNGTGSASANYLFAKAVFRMGIPVSPKNIFPSNIQGLPTWYEVRISDKGYIGRRAGVDIAVCVNPQSMAEDISQVLPDGYFVFDSSKLLREELWRSDIHFIGIPLTNICNQEYTDPRQRQLFKNVIYVGAMSQLLGIPIELLTDILKEQFKGKDKLIAPNVKALQLGIDYIKMQYPDPIRFGLEKRDAVGDQILYDGNSACGLGAIYAGATVAAWYPITPSTSVVEAFQDYCDEYRIDEVTGKKNFAIVQAEDELAAIGMVIGANWNGARAFTATSGPGISLMNEFLGLAYFAEIPTVLVDVQRCGPSTGMPTRTQQSDIMLCAYASHGDTKHVMVFPSTPKECFDMMADSFDLAEHLQTPVILMTDLDLGMNDHMSAPLVWDSNRKINRGKVLNAEDLENTAAWGRYLDGDGDGVTYRTIPGTHPTKGSFFTRGTSRDEYARYTEDGQVYVRNMERLLRKWDTAKNLVPAPEFYQEANTNSHGVIYFGTSTQSSLEAIDLLQEEGYSFDAMRIRAFPFSQAVLDFINAHERVFVIEQNRDAQMRSLLVNELEVNPKRLIKILNFDGMPITAATIVSKILPEMVYATTSGIPQSIA
ncbi:MAG: 2-oxoacid:acceptor oxidoreductase subunit alpha [Saprospiraceae bacterium]